MNSKHHESDVLEVTIQLLVVNTKEIYKYSHHKQLNGGIYIYIIYYMHYIHLNQIVQIVYIFL